MSQRTKRIEVSQEVIESYTCDGCGNRIDPEDWGESQEMLHWSMRGGYGSVFGDGTLVTLDLCQACVKARLGDILQHPEDCLDNPALGCVSCFPTDDCPKDCIERNAGVEE